MTTKISKIIALILVTYLLSSGCAPIYIPNAHNVPQVDQKGEIQAGAILGTNGIDLQGSYAPADHQAVMASISGNLSSDDINSQHLYAEGGYGIFNKNPNWLRASAFGGIGIGTAESRSTWHINGNDVTITASGTYLKPFLQGNIGLHSSVADIGISSRFAYLNFTSAETNGQISEETIDAFMIEPVVYLNAGWDFVKLSAYGGLSFPSNTGDINFSYIPFMFGAGLQFFLNAQDP